MSDWEVGHIFFAVEKNNSPIAHCQDFFANFVPVILDLFYGYVEDEVRNYVN